MSIVRLGAAALLAALITFALFFVMQMLITMGSGEAARVTAGPMIEFVRLRRDTDTLTRKRELPEKQKPPEAPPPPDLDLAPADAPDAGELAIAAPGIDLTPNIKGGLDIGAGASDAESIPLVRVPPEYPMRALERGVEGWVLIHFTMLPDGSVVDPEVVEADPPRVFDRSALRAVRRWKFRPKVVDGQPVQSLGKITITFKLGAE